MDRAHEKIKKENFIDELDKARNEAASVIYELKNLALMGDMISANQDEAEQIDFGSTFGTLIRLADVALAEIEKIERIIYEIQQQTKKEAVNGTKKS